MLPLPALWGAWSVPAVVPPPPFAVRHHQSAPASAQHWPPLLVPLRAALFACRPASAACNKLVCRCICSVLLPSLRAYVTGHACCTAWLVCMWWRRAQRSTDTLRNSADARLSCWTALPSWPCCCLRMASRCRRCAFPVPRPRCRLLPPAAALPCPASALPAAAAPCPAACAPPTGVVAPWSAAQLAARWALRCLEAQRGEMQGGCRGRGREVPRGSCLLLLCAFKSPHPTSGPCPPTTRSCMAPRPCPPHLLVAA